MITAGLNNLFGEIMWFYPTASSGVVNKMVCYNYQDSSPQRPIWTIGTLARTVWKDSAIFGKPHALEYDANSTEPATSATYVQGNTDAYQHTTNMKQAQIKLKAEQFQQLQQTYYQETLILLSNKQVLQTLEVMVSLL